MQKGVQPEWLKGKGGRPKGSVTKFKREAWESLHTQLDALNFNALETAVKLIRSRRCPVSEKARLLTCIMSLQFPKVQAIASIRKQVHSIDPQTWAKLASNPAFASAMEAITFEVENQKALPAPEPTISHEFLTDGPHVPGEPGASLSTPN